jgi:hypothetical protein
VAVAQFLAALARSASERIGLWSEPINLMAKPIHVAASQNEPGYVVLDRILAGLDTRLS